MSAFVRTAASATAAALFALVTLAAAVGPAANAALLA